MRFFPRRKKIVPLPKGYKELDAKATAVDKNINQIRAELASIRYDTEENINKLLLHQWQTYSEMTRLLPHNTKWKHLSAVAYERILERMKTR